MKKIDLGCGNTKKNGFIGVDCLSLPNVDIIHNLNQFPYPFKSDEIDEIWMDQCLEHVEHPTMVVDEIYRICKNGAKITIGVPFFRSVYAFIDPTHRNFFTPEWFNYFDPNHVFYKRYAYSSSQFSVDRIQFDREWDIYFYKNYIFVKWRLLLHKLIVSFANIKPFVYTVKVSHFYPLNSLTFYLTVIK